MLIFGCDDGDGGGCGVSGASIVFSAFFPNHFSTLLRIVFSTENVKLIDIMLNGMATDDGVILTQGTGFIASSHNRGRSTPSPSTLDVHFLMGHVR